MKKVLSIIFLAFFCMFNLSYAQSWTEETARQEALRDIKYNIDVSQYPPIDPDFAENQQAIKKGQEYVKDRFITVHTEPPMYVVSKINNKRIPQITMFYGMDGKLLVVRLFSSSDYPRASYIYRVGDTENGKYQPGQLNSFEFHISLTDSYAFGPDGSFRGHYKE